MRDIGKTIYEYRMLRKMTQEEFASRLGVTSQAVSKWERGNGLPDVSLIAGICTVLGINTDTLFGITERVVEGGNPMDDTEVKNNLISEPLVVEFSETLIPVICEGLRSDSVLKCRKRLAGQTGILLPIIRFRDNCSLDKDTYRILVYDKEVLREVAKNTEQSFFEELIVWLENYCRSNYDKLINKHTVKILIDNLKNQYPGVADGVVPEQISYLQVEQKLKEKLKAGESIKDLIHIVEELELSTPNDTKGTSKCVY